MSIAIWHPTIHTIRQATRFLTGEIGDGGDNILTMLFSMPGVLSPTADYATGVTIKRNDVVDAIVSDSVSADNLTVTLTMTTNAMYGDVWTVEYDEAFGDWIEPTTEIAVRSFGPVVITNNVMIVPGGEWHFNDKFNSGQILTLGL